MAELTGLKALAFDYYGTIADKGALAATVDEKFPGKGAAFTKLWFAQTQRYCFQNGMMERYMTWDALTKAAFAFAAAEMGMDVDDATRDDWIAADQWLPVHAEAPAALERLAGKFSLHVLSMASPWMIEQSQQNAGITEHFSGLISAEPEGLYKPGRAAYQLGVDRIGLPGEAIGFVSGNSFDVIGAKNFGYPSIWVRRTGQPLDGLGPEPDLVVGDLMAMAEALGA